MNEWRSVIVMRLRRFLSAAALALLLITTLTPGVQAQDDYGKLERALTRLFERAEDVAQKLATLLAPLPACATLEGGNVRITNVDGALDGTIYCREIARDGEFRINPGAIGEQSVIERGVQQAYDVFGLTDAGVAVERFDHAITVCLKGRGDLVFLGAFATPRVAQSPQSFQMNGEAGAFTCARLGSPGIVTLVNR
jgi:hypothetical protein